MRSLLIPLAFYLAVTLAVPLLNGTTGGGFLEHTVIVLAVAGLVGGAFTTANLLFRKRAR